MKKIFLTIIISVVTLSCGDDFDDNINTESEVTTTFNFSHNWNGDSVTNQEFNSIQYTNENNDELSIEKLRYLISNITLHKLTGETIVIEGHNLVDVTNNTNLNYTPEITIPKGEYTNVTFTFGFNNSENYDQSYPDLNSASWNVPDMLGGGYHFMQLEGKFIDDTTNETGYAYHTIRAVDNSDPMALVFQDTFFDVDLGAVTISNHATFNINMNIAEWFKSPNQWNLNTINNMMMPNFNAQVMMFQNGQNVFSLESITQ